MRRRLILALLAVLLFAAGSPRASAITVDDWLDVAVADATIEYGGTAYADCGARKVRNPEACRRDISAAIAVARVARAKLAVAAELPTLVPVKGGEYMINSGHTNAIAGGKDILAQADALLQGAYRFHFGASGQRKAP